MVVQDEEVSEVLDVLEPAASVDEFSSPDSSPRRTHHGSLRLPSAASDFTATTPAASSASPSPRSRTKVQFDDASAGQGDVEAKPRHIKRRESVTKPVFDDPHFGDRSVQPRRATQPPCSGIHEVGRKRV